MVMVMYRGVAVVERKLGDGVHVGKSRRRRGGEKSLFFF